MESKDEMEFDPNRTPHSPNAPNFQYIPSPHGENQKLIVNSNTGVIQPIPGGPQFPIEIPLELRGINQPYIHTCGPERKDSSGMWINRGCPAHNNCAIVQWYKDPKYQRPTNVIITKFGKIDSVPCFYAYCGTSSSGRPTSQVGYQRDGWHILTDRTTIPQRVMDPDTRRVTEIETEVPDLAPFYDKIKQAKAAAVVEQPKRRGRPKKVRDESAATV